jgi:hypothetical protein
MLKSPAQGRALQGSIDACRLTGLIVGRCENAARHMNNHSDCCLFHLNSGAAAATPQQLQLHASDPLAQHMHFRGA